MTERANDSRLFLALVLAVMAACDGSGTPADDGGVDSGTEGTATAPTPPAPLSWTCPDGWRPSTLAEGAVVCEPWPAGGRATCDDDEAHFPGEPGCARVGTACPPDGWPTDLPEDAPVLYVRAGAAEGDGSRASPLPSIGAAMARAEAGAVIAVASGVYDEMVTMRPFVTVRGACVAETTLGTPGSTIGMYGRITSGVEGAAVENLSITGGRPGLWIHAGGALKATDVVVRSTAIGGVTVLGDFEAESLVVRQAQSTADGRFGRGLHAEGTAKVVLRRAVFDANREVALFARGAAVTLDVEDLAIFATEAQASDATSGIGMIIAGGAAADARRIVVEDNHTAGINVGETGTVARFSHLVVRGTQAQPSDGLSGAGLFVAGGATAEIAFGWLAGNRHAGVSVYASGSHVSASDVAIVGTRGRLGAGGGIGGSGLFAIDGASAALNRAFVDDNEAAGVAVYGAGGELTLEDIVVMRTRPQGYDRVGGAGILFDLDTRGSVQRARVTQNRMVGILASTGTSVTLEDIEVTDTESDEASGRFGRGVEAIEGARMTLTRALLERNRSAGVALFGATTEVTAVDVVVRDTGRESCAEAETEVCGGGGFGFAIREGSLEGSRFVIERAALAGLQVTRGGRVRLARGRIADSPIGLNVQDSDVDLERDLVDVSLVGNGRNLDFETLPVPEPAEPPREL